MIGKNVNIRKWEENLFEAIKNVSDNEFQNEVWLGKNPKLVSSFDEIIMVLYDDNDFLNYTEVIDAQAMIN